MFLLTPSATKTSRRLATWLFFPLAVILALFAPVSVAAGTQTPTLRFVTAGALAAAGAVLYFSRGRIVVALAAVVPLVAAGFVTQTTWLGVMAFVVVVNMVVDRVWTRISPHTEDGPKEGAERHEESATDVIESIATAFILALVVREFAFEAFKIPTGSMEPTIYGEGFGRRKGDRLLAAKAPLLFAAPERWSIVVFKYPLFRPTNFIKRLIGLPGEHVENRDGDIYVNGKVAAKPEEVQESLWRALVPDESGAWRGAGVGDAFIGDNGAKWTFEQDAVTATAAAGKTGWLIHDAGVGDVRASFDVDPSNLGDGAVLVRIDGAKRRVELEARRDAMYLSSPGVAEKAKLDVDGLGAKPSRLGFAVADRVVRVYRDGRLVARVETADEANIKTLADQTSIGVSGGTARVSKIRLEQDLQYGKYFGMPNAWDVPADRYFMLGDNTGASRDSRAWKGRVFRLKTGGEPIVVDVESVRVDESSPPVPSLRDLGDAYDVFDSYGVRRRIAKDDLVGGVWTEENQPFVRREDIVGRAFLIFFPFPPFGDWRPRLLP
jgi:signal peptidase I